MCCASLVIWTKPTALRFDAAMAPRPSHSKKRQPSSLTARAEQAAAARAPKMVRSEHAALIATADTPASLLYRLGVLEAEAGHGAEALSLMEAAHRRSPADATRAVNLAQLRLTLGDPTGALTLLRALSAEVRAHSAVARLIGDAEAETGSFERAANAYAHALANGTDDPALHINLGAVLRRLGRWRQASHHLRTALAKGPIVEATVAMSALYLDLEQSDKAIDLLRAGLSKSPLSEPLWRQLAVAARADGDGYTARWAATRAAVLVPDSSNNTAAIAEQAENRAALDDACVWANRALVIDPRSLAASRVRLRVDRRRNRNDAVLATARALLAEETEPRRRYPVLFERAQALEALGHTRDAFDAFTEANNTQMATVPVCRDPARAHAQIAALADLYRQGLPAVPEAGAINDGPVPLFLIGFPRSGTTLLDQVLDAHPAITVVEERPLVPGLIARLREAGMDYPVGVSALDADRREELRAWYRGAMARHMLTSSSVYAVDKMPLNLVHAGLIRQVFPEARFLLAMRHPCDVVLSCFMQNFQLNDWMAAFASLEGTAALYRAVFGLWETYVARFDPPRAMVRYEDLVDDLEGQARRVLSFLDLPWHDGMLRFHEHARDRGVLATPSASQVTRPIYRTAVARWRRYDFAMTAVAEGLAEEIKRYGYAEEPA